METGTPVRPNVRVGIFTGLMDAGAAAVVAGTLDWASVWLAPTTEPTPTTPSVLTKSRRETLFSFIGFFAFGSAFAVSERRWFHINTSLKLREQFAGFPHQLPNGQFMRTRPFRRRVVEAG